MRLGVDGHDEATRARRVRPAQAREAHFYIVLSFIRAHHAAQRQICRDLVGRRDDYAHAECIAVVKESEQSVALAETALESFPRKYGRKKEREMSLIHSTLSQNVFTKSDAQLWICRRA